MHIKDAPRRVQREYYRRARIANAIAILVVIAVLGGIAYAIVRLAT
jgi:hypothetical protein